MSRTDCSGEAMTLRLISSRPAAYISSARPSRSRMAAMVTRSTSSAGTASASLASVALRRSECGSDAGGGQVVEVLVVARNPEVGRFQRAEVDRGGEEVVGDPVDIGGVAGGTRVAHDL